MLASSTPSNTLALIEWRRFPSPHHDFTAVAQILFGLRQTASTYFAEASCRLSTRIGVLPPLTSLESFSSPISPRRHLHARTSASMYSERHSCQKNIFILQVAPVQPKQTAGARQGALKGPPFAYLNVATKKLPVAPFVKENLIQLPYLTSPANQHVSMMREDHLEFHRHHAVSTSPALAFLLICLCSHLASKHILEKDLITAQSNRKGERGPEDQFKRTKSSFVEIGKYSRKSRSRFSAERRTPL